MSEEQALVSVEQRTVQFYGDELVAIEASDGQIYVAVRHMCKALGLTTAPQTRRIKRHPVLVEGYKGVTIMVTPGGQQRTGMLRVDLVPLWLTGISTNAIKEEIRPKLERYQLEAAKVLWEAFREGRLTGDLALDDLLASDSPAAQAYKMASAIMQMARQQLFLEAQLQDHSRQLMDHEGRLEQIETTLGDPGRHVTPEQASQLSQSVKAVAMELSKQSGRNEYGGVYGELYRKFSITSYKLLPAGNFDAAMNWLTEWHQTLTGDEPF
jgi:ferritin-like metal-binding protein YciE